MKIVRHTAKDMRQALRGIREQLGEDAVILSSRRTAAGVEVTAAVELDASTLEAEGFANSPPPLTASAAPMAAATSNAMASIMASAAPPAAFGAPAHLETPVAVFPAVRSVAVPADPVAYRIEDEPEVISRAAREAVAAHHSIPVAAQPGPEVVPDSIPARAPAAAPAGTAAATSVPAAVARAARAAASDARPADAPARAAPPSLDPVQPIDPDSVISAPTLSAAPTEIPLYAADDPVQQAFASSLLPFGAIEADNLPAATAVHAVSPTDAMGNELKTLRRMLETQLAQLAWNDLTRRAPIHTEILRELTEIGITQELAELLIRQLPHDTDLTFARRFAIAGLSQYLRVTGDRWLGQGGRIAFVGSTGVGKTTTLAKVAVRWVLRHGPRGVALISADCVRIGAQDQLQSLGQLLGVPVYTVEGFDALPGVLDRISERLVLIDTPGASLRDAQLGERLAPLAARSARIETALVLAASTQAGALEDAVARFEPANPSCCVLTKLDEAASLGGALSVLIRARLPVSYLSEGQRVPEDLRPARALELVSSAVQLAKTSGAAADEDLLRRRFGRNAHAFN